MGKYGPWYFCAGIGPLQLGVVLVFLIVSYYWQLSIFEQSKEIQTVLEKARGSNMDVAEVHASHPNIRAGEIVSKIELLAEHTNNHLTPRYDFKYKKLNCFDD